MRKIGDKGFSLVELIIVMAIMAVLTGILTPQYMKYLDKTKKTTDCSAISTVLDACEVIAGDPDVEWENGASFQITIVISDVGATYSDLEGIADVLNEYVPATEVKMLSRDWGTITIYAVKNGSDVNFEISDDTQKEVLKQYSEALAKRLQ